MRVEAFQACTELPCSGAARPTQHFQRSHVPRYFLLHQPEVRWARRNKCLTLAKVTLAGHHFQTHMQSWTQQRQASVRMYLQHCSLMLKSENSNILDWLGSCQSSGLVTQQSQLSLSHSHIVWLEGEATPQSEVQIRISLSISLYLSGLWGSSFDLRDLFFLWYPLSTVTWPVFPNQVCLIKFTAHLF